jgi:hypothetical protein
MRSLQKQHDSAFPDATFGLERPARTSFGGRAMLNRRELIKRAGMAALLTGVGSSRAFARDTVTLPFDNGERPLVKYPQKRPMIVLTSRPPQLETPFSVFNDGPITVNDAFFWRMCPPISIPTSSRWRSRARSTSRSGFH